ncbi:MAG: hypothetical protein ACRDPJ_21070 [Nocardioidaceae bacterium]
MDDETEARRVLQLRLVVEGGAELTAEPTVTPWQSLNARLSALADLQITLFEELGGTS